LEAKVKPVPTPVQRLRCIAHEADALQVIVGATSKADILSLCAQANVGVPGIADNHASTDLRWVVIPTPSGPVELRDGDWIVRAAGRYLVMPTNELWTWFETGLSTP